MILQKNTKNDIFESSTLQPDCVALNEVETKEYRLTQAKAQKINDLNAFILAEKTKPYTTFTAPELVPSIVNA